MAIHHLGRYPRKYLPESISSLPYRQYFGERVVREIRARRETKITSVKLHPSGALEVRFTKPSMKYKAGQWLFLNCPEVARFQWHPVSRPSLHRL